MTLRRLACQCSKFKLFIAEGYLFKAQASQAEPGLQVGRRRPMNDARAAARRHCHVPDKTLNRDGRVTARGNRDGRRPGLSNDSVMTGPNQSWTATRVIMMTCVRVSLIGMRVGRRWQRRPGRAARRVTVRVMPVPQSHGARASGKSRPGPGGGRRPHGTVTGCQCPTEHPIMLCEDLKTGPRPRPRHQALAGASDAGPGPTA